MFGAAEGFAQGALAEGQSVRWMTQMLAAPPATELRGELWSKPVTYGARQSEPFHRATAGFVFSLDHYSELDEAEQFVVASYARAVSPVTSYLAIEPGVRPSTDGFETGTGIGFGSGAGSLGFGRGASSPRIDWTAIRTAARKACAAHRAAGEITHLRVEVQDREVANVTIASAKTASASCAHEWLWAHQLPVGAVGDYVKVLTL
jgi:hypothetical protein